MQTLVNPLPIWLDKRGALIDAGKIYVGEAGQNPEEHPIAVFWDADGVEEADQPLRTLGGVIVNGETPAPVFIEEEDWSVRIRDANDVIVFSVLSMADLGGGVEASYQPLNANLTALAAVAGQTPYGRALLTLANQAALVAALGLPAALPLTGGTVTGNIIRSGVGAHLYHATSGFNSGRVFLTAAGAPDPTSLPGDIWLTY